MFSLNSKKRKSKEPAIEDPRESKTLVYVALGLTVTGAILALIPTIIMIMPFYEISFSNFYLDPMFYILLAGIILVTVGLIMHRKVTPPMQFDETERLKSRLE